MYFKYKKKPLTSDQKKTLPESLLLWVQIIAIILAGIWGTTTYYYEKITLPTEEPTYLVISAINELVGKKDTNVVIRSTVSIKNMSKARTYIIASKFIVSAYRISPESYDNTTYSAYVQSNINNYDKLPRFFEENGTVMNVGKLIADGYRLDSQEEFNTQFVSIVPGKKYDMVRFFFLLYGAKDSIQTRITWKVLANGEILEEILKLPESLPLRRQYFKKYIDKVGFGTTYSINELSLLPQVDTLFIRSDQK